MEDNLVFLVQQLLIRNQIKIDKKELEFQIQSHPSYPSLHAITGVLTHFNIENMALQVPIDEMTLSQLPKHFIALIKIEQKKDFVVVSKDSLNYNIIFSINKKARYTIDEFLEKFTGIIVGVEREKNIEVSKQQPNTSFLKIIFWITGLSILVFWIFSESSLYNTLLLLASFGGIYVSYSIYKQEQGEKTSLGETFCSDENKKSDCDSVISSKGANLFGFIKLSDLSLIYFLGLALFEFLLSISGLSPRLLYTIILLAVVITIYSLYYQAFIVKAWCGLCLSIVILLWIQAGIVLINLKTISVFSFTSKEIILGVLSFSVIASIWFFLKPNFKKIRVLQEEKIRFYRFKRNFNLFNTLLNTSQKISTSIESSISEIILGNTQRTLPIVIVTNPFCGHCKAVHTLVEDIYKKYKKFTNISIRFNINVVDKESDIVKITSRLIELFHKEGTDTAMQAMHAIYTGQDPLRWLNEWGNCSDPEKYISVLEKEKKWCEENNINFTPEILIDGRAFPKEYDRSDLVYFIEELQEKHVENLMAYISQKQDI